MALSTSWPIVGVRRPDWGRDVATYGFCEVLPDRRKPGEVEKAFEEWALKRHLAYVRGETLVAFDPKHFSPKDSLDRARFGFLARYLRPRDSSAYRKDLKEAFGVRSMAMLNAVQAYWAQEGIVHEGNGMVQANRDLVRLMGFSSIEIMEALDGVVRKDYLDAATSGHLVVTPALCEDRGHYVVNFPMMKDRFFDGEFAIQAAGQPVPFSELGRQMGIEHDDDLKEILREAKKRYDLNIEVTDTHVMFGPPSPSAVEHLIARERGHKDKLTETESALRERRTAVNGLLDRYIKREAKIMNEIETLKEEGRSVYVKGKVVQAVEQRLEQGRSS